VRVDFEYDRDLARAVNAYYGEEGEATHQEMRDWFRNNGESCISDVSMECPDFEEMEEAS
jgi:hypothetical protein